jgi:hypothetical protein
MKSIICLLLLLGVTSLMTGCVEGFTILVKDSGDRTPTFQFLSRGLLPRPGVDIETFNLSSYPGDGKDFIWGIESSDKKPHRVKEVKYGVVPEGFQQSNLPPSLVSGHHYVAGTHMPGKMGQVDFVLK